MPPRAPYCSAALLSRDKNSSGKWLPLSRWSEGGFIRSAALRRSDQGLPPGGRAPDNRARSTTAILLDRPDDQMRHILAQGGKRRHVEAAALGARGDRFSIGGYMCSRQTGSQSRPAPSKSPSSTDFLSRRSRTKPRTPRRWKRERGQNTSGTGMKS